MKHSCVKNDLFVRSSSGYRSFQIKWSATLLVIVYLKASAFSCGGGVVPYIPSGTGAGSASNGQFFLIDKGVTTTMMDSKSLQPIFKNIVNSGNERKDRSTGKNQSTGSAADSVKTDPSKGSILNLHRLH